MPAVDAVASQYQGEVTFVAVAGRSSASASARIAPTLFDESRIFWGYDEELWQTYGVRGQPVTFLIDDGQIVDQWFGIRGEDAVTGLLDSILG